MRPPRSRCRSKSSSGAGNRVPGPGITSGEQTGKALVSPWRERVDDTSATSSPAKCRVRPPFQGAGILTGYCTLVKGERASEPSGQRRKERERGRGLGFLSAAYDRACAYRIPWESAICTAYPLGYVVVLIKTRSPER